MHGLPRREKYFSLLLDKYLHRRYPPASKPLVVRLVLPEPAPVPSCLRVTSRSLSIRRKEVTPQLSVQRALPKVSASKPTRSRSQSRKAVSLRREVSRRPLEQQAPLRKLSMEIKPW